MSSNACVLSKTTDAIQCWTTLHEGCQIREAGCSALFKTGDWRTGMRPRVDHDKCTKCGRCYIMCPDMAWIPRGDEMYDWSADYCKGCGICAVECPVDAIIMIEEA